MAASSRPSVVLLLVLAVALAAGAAASLLAGVATSSGSSSGPATELLLPSWVPIVALYVFAGLVIGYLIYQRLSGQTMPVPARYTLTILLTVFLAVVFVIAAHGAFFSGGAGPHSASPSSGNGTIPPANTTTGNATSLGGPGGYLWTPTVPAWVPFALIAIVAIVGGVFLTPQIRGYLADRRDRRNRRGRAATPAAELRSALQRANAELEHGTDARAVILALYGTVIDRVSTIVGSVEVETPEEIRSHHLVRLGIRPATAEELTRLFEEARYSTHPLSLPTVDRVRNAVRDAMADLARGSGP
jgi:hypothetical protein